MQLIDISIFPLKSARGVSVREAEIEPRGLKGDRRWMIVDARGRFVSQRELPALARLAAEPTGGGLRLCMDGAELDVLRPGPHAARVAASVWDDTLLLGEAESAAAWLTRMFGQPLRLVFQPDEARRPVRAWAEPGDEVSLADGFPILLATVASLDAMRAEVGAGLRMERFRPNLVIDGAGAWDEDGWARLRIGEAELDLVKPCPRCTVTTVDQEKGIFAGPEPLDALRRMRMSGDRRVAGVLFGWNAVPRRLGVVRVGDTVELVGARERWAIRPQRMAAPA